MFDFEDLDFETAELLNVFKLQIIHIAFFSALNYGPNMLATRQLSLEASTAPSLPPPSLPPPSFPLSHCFCFPVTKCQFLKCTRSTHSEMKIFLTDGFRQKLHLADAQDVPNPSTG